MADPALVSTLSTLSTQLSTLETSLAPLLAVPYADLIANDENAPLAKAKLDVLVSYALHDLIWVYLKTSGVEPTNHPVMAEIERLKGYFAKLKSAESGSSPSTSNGKDQQQRRMQIDKQAASRFINHAIASQKARVDPSYTAGEEDVEMGTHTRFDAEDDDQDGEAEEERQEGGIEKNEEVERLLDEPEEDSEEEDEKLEEIKEFAKGLKGKRKMLDPFAGYDQPKPTASTEKRKKVVSSTKSESSTPAKDQSEESSGVTTTGSASKKDKKKKDKKKLKMKK